jgi:hypothetical protein
MRPIRDLVVSAAIASGLVLFCDVATAQNVFPASGYVGIGTTSPTGMFHILGAGRTDVNFDAPSGNNFSLNFLAGGVPRLSLYRQATTGDLVIDSNNAANILHLTSMGNVGIGTATPLANLHVSGPGRTTLMLDAPAANSSLLNFLSGGQSRFSIFRPANTSDLSMDSNVMPSVLYLTNDGRIGVGTNNPAAKLHVTGAVQVDGNIAAKYQDVAEWVKTSGHVPYGTVVVIDTLQRDRVLPASQPYDTRVAGVVSENPGVLLGTEEDGKAKIAHSGRVRVRVDTSNGPVAVGDLLVTSPAEGYAMRSTPVDVGGVAIHRPGTLIGKALEPLDQGRGEILVLLMLQ